MSFPGQFSQSKAVFKTVSHTGQKVRVHSGSELKLEPDTEAGFLLNLNTQYVISPLRSLN